MVQTNLAMLVPFLIATTLAFPQVILASSSYELPKFTSSSKYFGQSDPDIDVSKVNVSDNFGLINKYSWKDVIDSLSDNEKLLKILSALTCVFKFIGTTNITKKIVNIK